MNTSERIEAIKNKPIGKLTGSPSQSENENFLDFSIPGEISWGSPLPIYSYLKPKKETEYSAFQSRAHIDSKEPMEGISIPVCPFKGTSVLISETIPQLLKKEGELYYNFLALEQRVLPPGTYDIWLDAYAGSYQTADNKQTFRIKADGWLNQYSDIIKKLICNQDFEKGILPYLEKLSMAKIKTPRDPLMAQIQMQELHDLWKAGFGPFSELLSVELKNKILAVDYHYDSTISYHTLKVAKSLCKNRLTNSIFIDDIASSIRLYEISK